MCLGPGARRPDPSWRSARGRPAGPPAARRRQRAHGMPSRRGYASRRAAGRAGSATRVLPPVSGRAHTDLDHRPAGMAATLPGPRPERIRPLLRGMFAYPEPVRQDLSRDDAIAQPPEATSAMNCGPDAVLERRGGAVLHCPRCASAPVPAFRCSCSPEQRHRQTPMHRAVAPCTARAACLRTDIILQVAALGGTPGAHLSPARPRHRTQRPRDRPVRIAAARQMETLPPASSSAPSRSCTLDCPTPSR